MRARTWGIVILVNAIISAAVVLVVLLTWNRARTPEAAQTGTPSPMAAVAAATLTHPAGSATGAAAPPVEQAPVSTFLTHTVQSGDTVSGIAAAYGVTIEELLAVNDLADPNVLSLGQVLSIPLPAPPDAAPAAPTAEGAAPAGPSPTPLPTPTTVGPPLVEIRAVTSPGDVLAESVLIRNSGGLADLAQWTLSDNQGNAFIFPAVTLFTDAELRIHSDQGAAQPTDLFWGRTKPAWSSGELLSLRDAHGALVDTFVVPSG
jgi:LysM repeat protein